MYSNTATNVIIGCFKIKDLGVLKYSLSLEKVYGISFSQRKYYLNLLKLRIKAYQITPLLYNLQDVGNYIIYKLHAFAHQFFTMTSAMHYIL